MLISIKISGNSAFLGPDKHRMLFFQLINVKMPTIVGILTVMSRKNFMLNSVEHEKSFITSGPGFAYQSIPDPELFYTYFVGGIQWALRPGFIL